LFLSDHGDDDTCQLKFEMPSFFRSNAIAKEKVLLNAQKPYSLFFVKKQDTGYMEKVPRNNQSLQN
tara:strand:+ start:85 stop:282 length:198 start_codon:yes stop_codon:yes gene_type:complete